MTSKTVSPGQWSPSQANDWYAAQPWHLGFNFLPSTAVNFLEMWQAATFDEATIRRELGWAAALGYNALRTNPQYLIWTEDRDGLLARIDRLAGIAGEAGIGVVLCPFDDCGFGGVEPHLGRQPDPVAGVHNSRAVASPGRAAVMDEDRFAGFETYLRDLLRRFGADPRILFWDLYNEPGNRMIFRESGYDVHDAAMERHSSALMRACFSWARDETPEQPLTVGAWMTPVAGDDTAPFTGPIDSAALDLSDIVTFHAYRDPAAVAGFLDLLDARGRPVLCTEWMARPVGSTIADLLKLFRERKVGCYQWGLVNGRSQTHLPWPEALVAAHGGKADRSVWFHDVLHPDGTPYSDAEADMLQALSPRTA